MQRRFFIRQTTTGATAAAASPLIGLAASLRSEAIDPKTTALIDTDISLGYWPFAHVGTDPGELAAQLRENGVVQAWAGSFDALLHHDLDSVNNRLAALSREHSVFLPMGAVNPKLRGWKRTLDRLATVHHMRGIRLHPDFHGYSLDDPDFAALLEAATAKNLLVQISLGENPKARPVSPRYELTKVNPALLLDVADASHRIQLLNAGETIRSGKLAIELAGKGIHFATSNGSEKWLADLPAESVQFGSHSPLVPFAGFSSELALEAGQITAISSHNAENLMVQV